MQNINETEFNELIATNDDVIVIDVRTPLEIKEGMIAHAIHHDIFESDFTDKIKSLDKSKKYVMVCRSGNRSRSACDILESNNITTVYNLIGGMMLWQGKTVEALH